MKPSREELAIYDKPVLTKPEFSDEEVEAIIGRKPTDEELELLNQQVRTPELTQQELRELFEECGLKIIDNIDPLVRKNL